MHAPTRASTIVVLLLALAGARASVAQETAARLLPPSPGVRRGTPATITYVVEKPVKSMAIEVVDGRGRVVARFSSLPDEALALGRDALSLTPGQHRVTWDLHHACCTAFVGLESRADIQDMEPLVVPGTFEVRLETDGQRVSAPLIVTLAAGHRATAADLDAASKLAIEMCDRRRTALSAVARVRSHAEILRRLPASQDEARNAAEKDLRERMAAAEALIAGDQGDATLSTAGAVLPWCVRLARLQREVTASDARPSESAYAAFRALDSELETLLRQLPAQETSATAGQPGASIRFDSEGVDFTRWLKAFIARVKKGWNVPYALVGSRGRTVVTFYVLKSGEITEVTIKEASSIEAFNEVSRQALLNANPAAPLPKGYRHDRCFFTVTFFYNEIPSQ